MDPWGLEQPDPHIAAGDCVCQQFPVEKKLQRINPNRLCLQQ